MYVKCNAQSAVTCRKAGFNLCYICMLLHVGKFYGVDPKDKDGVELFLNCFVVVGTGISIFVIPGAYFLLKSHPKMLPNVLFQNPKIANVFLGFHFGYNTFAACIATFIFVGLIFIMFNGNIGWFKRMR